MTHSAQYGFAALLKAVNDGVYKYRDDVKEYGEKAKIMKKLFLASDLRGRDLLRAQRAADDGEHDRDLDEPLADGFYFTVSYPGMSGKQLLEELLCYGISAISLDITGSNRLEGLRACVSQVSRDQLKILEYRLKRFMDDHPSEKK